MRLVVCFRVTIHPINYIHSQITNEKKLTSGAALVGLYAPMGTFTVAEENGLHAWLDDDSTNVGGLINEEPRRGLFLTL